MESHLYSYVIEIQQRSYVNVYAV